MGFHQLIENSNLGPGAWCRVMCFRLINLFVLLITASCVAVIEIMALILKIICGYSTISINETYKGSIWFRIVVASLLAKCRTKRCLLFQWMPWWTTYLHLTFSNALMLSIPKHFNHNRSSSGKPPSNLLHAVRCPDNSSHRMILHINSSFESVGSHFMVKSHRSTGEAYAVRTMMPHPLLMLVNW